MVSLFVGVAVLVVGFLPLRVGATLGTLGRPLVTELALVTRMLFVEVGGLFVQLRGLFMSLPRLHVRLT